MYYKFRIKNCNMYKDEFENSQELFKKYVKNIFSLNIETLKNSNILNIYTEGDDLLIKIYSISTPFNINTIYKDGKFLYNIVDNGTILFNFVKNRGTGRFYDILVENNFLSTLLMDKFSKFIENRINEFNSFEIDVNTGKILAFEEFDSKLLMKCPHCQEEIVYNPDMLEEKETQSVYERIERGIFRKYKIWDTTNYINYEYKCPKCGRVIEQSFLDSQKTRRVRVK